MHNNSTMCIFCYTQPEMLEQIFYDYYKMDLWRTVEQWTIAKGEHIQLNRNTVFIFSTNKPQKFINWLIMNVKNYKYINRIKKLS